MRGLPPSKSLFNISSAEHFVKRKLKNFQVLLAREFHVLSNENFSDIRSHGVNLTDENNIHYYFGDIENLAAKAVDFESLLAESQPAYSIFLKDNEKMHSKILQSIMIQNAPEDFVCSHWPNVCLQKHVRNTDDLLQVCKAFFTEFACHKADSSGKLLGFARKLSKLQKEFKFKVSDLLIKSDGLLMSQHLSLQLVSSNMKKLTAMIGQLTSANVYALILQPNIAALTLDVVVVQPTELMLRAHAHGGGKLTLFVLSNVSQENQKSKLEAS